MSIAMGTTRAVGEGGTGHRTGGGCGRRTAWLTGGGVVMPGSGKQQHWHSHVSVRIPFGHGELHEAPSDPAAALTVRSPSTGLPSFLNRSKYFDS